MNMFRIVCFLLAVARIVCAQPAPGVSLSVSTETVPAGGVAQVKFFLTEPKPIVRSGMYADFDESFFDEFLGISAGFGLTGVAKPQNGRLRVELSGRQTRLQDSDYPILTAAIKTKPTLPVGATRQISLDLGNSFWTNPLGQIYPEEAKAGGVVIGGTMFVSNILPGGGTLQAGETMRVTGSGFISDLKVNMEGMELVSFSPTELLLRALVSTQTSGEEIRVELPSKEEARYFSYLRGTKVQPTANASLQGMMPVFSTQAYMAALAGLKNTAGHVAAIGLQNPTKAPVRIQLDDYSPSGQVLQRAFVTLGAGEVLFRSYEEIFGSTVPANSYVVMATTPRGAFQFVVAEVEAAGSGIVVPLVSSLRSGSY